jgi:uncharacterized membrane protein YeaQ/YmgE (transglycosylase-associated protein family)
MSLNTALVILVVGVLAGIVSKIAAKGRAFGLLVHVIVGVIGAYHGRLVFHLVGISATTLVGHLIFAGLGALLFLFPLRFIRPA